MSERNKKKVRKYDKDYKLIEEYSSIKEARNKNCMARSTMYQYLDSGKVLNGYLYFRIDSDSELVTQLKARKDEIEQELNKVEEAISYFS